jgi:two-component sensor histidine kinase
MKNGEERVAVLAADIVHANPLPMSITSLHDYRHLEVNEAAVRHSGFTRAELLGRSKAELGLWVAREQREEMLRRLREEGRVFDVITFGGEPAVLSVSLDITERKQEEAHSRARGDEAEAANRAKDEFPAMLGHELRNPLGTITNAVAVLERLTTDASMRHLTAIISRQTSHLTRLVDDLLDVARVTSGKIALDAQPVELHALAGRCLETLVHAGRTQEHRVALQGEPVHVVGDAARLEQIVNNLVDNALKYTPPGGTVTVTTERGGPDAILRVRDTGRGISADILARRPSTARAAASGSASRWSSGWSSCTAARSRPAARGPDRAASSPCAFPRWRARWVTRTGWTAPGRPAQRPRAASSSWRTARTRARACGSCCRTPATSSRRLTTARPASPSSRPSAPRSR